MARERGPTDKLFDFIASGRMGLPSRPLTIEQGNARAEEQAKLMKRAALERARKQNVPDGMVEVELHSYEPEAIEATRKTIEGLKGEARLLADDTGSRYYVPEGFVAWAVERQGYVKRVLT